MGLACNGSTAALCRRPCQPPSQLRHALQAGAAATPGGSCQTPELRFAFDPLSATSPHVNGIHNSGSKYAQDAAVPFKPEPTPFPDRVERALAAEQVGTGLGLLRACARARWKEACAGLSGSACSRVPRPARACSPPDAQRAVRCVKAAQSGDRGQEER